MEATDKSENTYGNILKRMSAFGGVQVFNILLSVLRGKFVAMFLGPAGMGVASLYNSSLTTLQSVGSLGLNLAIVKEVANAKDDRFRLQAVLAVAYRLILFTALLGGALCLLLAPFLSRRVFGSADYTPGLMLLSAAVALSIAGAAYLALLQGIGAVKKLTMSSIVGGLTGLCIGVPLYWLFGERGIVPSIIILAAAMLTFYYLSFRSLKVRSAVKFSLVEHRPLIRRIISTGLVLMVGSMIGSLTNYLINAYIRYAGSLNDVGLFQGANSITNQYVGLVFSAMALDYFPRLSAAVGNRLKFNEVVNRQIEIVSLIITPLVSLLIVTSPVVIRLLLTDEFLTTVPLMRWLGLGVLIQGITFPLSYTFIACDYRRLYFALEVVMSNLLWIICSVWFYHWLGLIGLGVSLVARTVVGDGIALCFIHRCFGVTLSRRNIKLIAMNLLLGLATFASTFFEEVPWYVFLLFPLISGAISADILRKQLRR